MESVFINVSNESALREIPLVGKDKDEDQPTSRALR